MLSLFENTNSKVTAHILHDNTLSTENRDKFIYLAGQYNQIVKFYNVEQLCTDKIVEIRNTLSENFKAEFSIAAMYRFLIPQIFSSEMEKIIYLDSDLIVNLDIKELWQFDLGDKIMGVVTEISNYKSRESILRIHALCRNGTVQAEDHFNSGVLLINLESLRREDNALTESIRLIGSNAQYIFFDQDVLNYCFSTRTLKLPVKFNKFVYLTNLQDKSSIERNIYHYLPKPEALGLDLSFALNRLWLKYFMKTPWFDEDSIGRLYASFRQVQIGLKNSLINLSTVMVGKRREFFAAPKDVDAFKKIFSIRTDEKIIVAENQESLNKLLDAMKRARGKKLFFIMLPRFPFKALTDAGFAPGKDFVNGLDFLSEAQGVPLNSYELIKAM